MSMHVTVIGAGFSGLVAAWALSRSGYQVTVIEKRSGPGGLIGTLDLDGFKVETAANGLLSSQLVEQLFEDSGVPVISTRKTARRRYLWVGGKVSRWPLGVFSSLRVLFGSLAIFAVKAFRPEKEESLQSWGARAFGHRFSDRVLATWVWGIFAATADSLSARLVTSRLYRTGETRHLRKSGRIRGTVSAAQGMGQLISGLRSTLESRGVKFQFDVDGERALREVLENASANSENRIVVATSASQAADLLAAFPIFSAQTKLLREIPMLSLLNIGIHFSKPAKRQGFGTLFSQDARVGGADDGILGALQNSVIFSGRCSEGSSSETWILGGRGHGERFLKLSDDELLALVLKKRREILGEEESEVLNFRVTRWPAAIPHFGKKLENVQTELNKQIGPVVLFGNYLGELGLRSILEQAEQLPLKLTKG
jgi:oxygen-dependent protoporphyrinogen oxidase